MRRGNGEMAPRGSAAAAAPFDVLAAVFLHTDLADLYNCQLVCQCELGWWLHQGRKPSNCLTHPSIRSMAPRRERRLGSARLVLEERLRFRK